jgi:hypothetical protein
MSDSFPVIDSLILDSVLNKLTISQEMRSLRNIEAFELGIATTVDSLCLPCRGNLQLKSCLSFPADLDLVDDSLYVNEDTAAVPHKSRSAVDLRTVTTELTGQGEN